ncbi:MAG: 3-phosphoshikimate 1-carboxyvinyltransferase [Pseudomonadota bacterium]
MNQPSPPPNTAIAAHPADGLSGVVAVPGDKSISHRALMLGGLAVGETVVRGLLEGEDVLATAEAMRAFGAEIGRDDGGVWRIWGRGVGGLKQPDDVIDLGNSGTGVRLLMGLAAGHPFASVFTGDASLRKRPMGRIARPLEAMGATFEGREGDRLPMTVKGSDFLMPITYETPVASAQIKSAVLLAGLHAPGETRVIETAASRDHTERMIRAFGGDVRVEPRDDGAFVITVTGQPELTPTAIAVPGDPSSAAFPLVAAALLPGAEVTVTGVGVNQLRKGLIVTLQEMGADLILENQREEGGEPVADVRIKGGDLAGVEVPAERAPTMIDEYPILAVAASAARGRTVMRGLEELRIKESDRLATMATGLKAAGVVVEELEDGLIIDGCAGRVPGGNNKPIATHLDHRIAMSFLILGLAAERPVTIDDPAPIATSFPDFLDLMTGLGARFEQ